MARKEKGSTAKVLDKYGVNVKRKQGTGTRRIFGVSYKTKEGTKTMTYFNDPSKKKANPLRGEKGNGVIEVVLPSRHPILDRINAKKCELCGHESANASTFEVHHVRKRKDIKQKYSKRGDHIPNGVLAMSSLKRKTLVVCKTCHHAIHAGTHGQSIQEAVRGKNAI